MGRPRKDIVKKPKGCKEYHYDWTVGGARFRGSTGEEKSIVTARKIALLKHKELKEAARRGRLTAAEMTVSEAFGLYWEEHGKHLDSSDFAWACLSALSRLLGDDTLLSEIDDARIASYVARRRQEPNNKGRALAKRVEAGKIAQTDHDAIVTAEHRISPTTINKELTTLFAVLRRAESVWKRNVAEIDRGQHKLKQPDYKEVFLTYVEATRLIDEIVPHAQDPVRLALYTALRRGNVLGLDWSDVHLESSLIVIQVKSPDHPGGKTHAVGIIPEARAPLERIEPDPRRRVGPVFYIGNPQVACSCHWCAQDANQGRPILGIKRAFNTARKKIGRPQVRFHDLRHTVASWILQNGYSLEYARKALGHEDISTTQRYAHLERSAVHDAMTDALSLGGHGAKKSA